MGRCGQGRHGCLGPLTAHRVHADAHPVNLQVVDATEVQLAVPTPVRYGEAQRQGHLGSGSGEQA